MLGLQKPPRWAIVSLVVLTVASIALVGYLLLRPAPTDPFAGQAAQTAPSTSEPAGPTGGPAAGSSPSLPDTTAEPLVLAVYGDGYSSGSSLGGVGERGWPAIAAARLNAELQLNAVPLAGYAAAGSGGATFPQLAASAPVPTATVTVVFGSRNDDDSTPAAVAEAAAATYTSILAAAPDTHLVVIGPAWSSAEAPAELGAIRDAVEQAADAAGATFVDPLADGWFDEPAGLIAGDGVSPLDTGHQYLAGLIIPTVQAALTAA